MSTEIQGALKFPAESFHHFVLESGVLIFEISPYSLQAIYLLVSKFSRSRVI